MQLQETRPRKIAGALRNTALLALPLLLFISYATQSSGASGSGGGSGGNPGPLSSVAVPIPPDLTTYVANSSSLVQLGKALFWDMQVGNDGKQACASCHFHAGADHRNTNQVNVAGVGPFLPNHLSTAADFPFHTPQVVGSGGVFPRRFADIVLGASVDDGSSTSGPSVNGINVRQVTGRNAPTVINAVFNVRNFWDARAKNIFTVFTPFGDSDPKSNIVLESGGTLQAVRIRLDNSSLASQSVGPALSSVEMSSAGRSWQKLGKKMLSLTPLDHQKVDPNDSVLGGLANTSANNGTGLNKNYAALIHEAFQQQCWNSTRLIDGNGNDIGSGAPANTNQFTQVEYNFALFWGVSVQAYEATLVSAASPYDQFAAGNKNALTSIQAQGLNIFTGKGQCTNCHTGPEFTAAAFTTVNQQGTVQSLSHGLKTDTGYFHTGVRPISDDPGLAGNDGFNVPLSLAAQQNPATAGVGGAFKTPTIRNTEFTGPFFHNGSTATLEQVVDFYSRGGDTPTDPNLGPGIQPLSFNASDKSALVEFMKALSDDRVRFEKAPFDHPQLCVANGEKNPVTATGDPKFTPEAVDNLVEIPAVGKGGGSAPLQTFGELIGASSAGGPRAHDLTQACTMK